MFQKISGLRNKEALSAFCLRDVSKLSEKTASSPKIFSTHAKQTTDDNYTSPLQAYLKAYFQELGTIRFVAAFSVEINNWDREHD